MKKVIIILSLIYFISCTSLCEDFEYVPTKKEDCYEKETTVTQNECCFLSIDYTFGEQKQSSMSCDEIPLGFDLEEEKKKIIQNSEAMGVKVDSINIYCHSHEKKPDTSSSSYLKIGFLLILCFIL